MTGTIFEELDNICERPAPFEFYTAADLWTDEHTSRQMLKFHLDNYYGFLNTFKYDREKVILDKYSVFEANRTRTVYNWLQYFGLEDLRRELADCGLQIKDVFADVARKAL